MTACGSLKASFVYVTVLGHNAGRAALVRGVDHRFLVSSGGEQAGRSRHMVGFSHHANGVVEQSFRTLWPPIRARDQDVICTTMPCFLNPSTTKADHPLGSSVCEFLKLRFFPPI